MKRDDKHPAEYVMRVREDTQRYVDKILYENRKLEAFVDSM